MLYCVANMGWFIHEYCVVQALLASINFMLLDYFVVHKSEYLRSV